MSLRSRAVDAVFGTLEGIAAVYDFVHGLRRVYRLSPSYKRDDNSGPLSHRDVERQQEQIRRATRPPK